MMKRNSYYYSLIAALLFVSLNGAAQETPAVADRQPVVAGTFYPASKAALESRLRKLFQEASPADLKGRLQTLIVPHAGYDYSGVVTASAFRSLPPDASYENVFIIATSHHAQFNGASVYPGASYITPLGKLPVNQDIANALIGDHRNISYHAEAHDREHSIEVQIPFIQYHFKNPPALVPIVLGSSSLSAARDLATALIPYFTPENLFIISTDFSHYPSYRDANRIDRNTGEAILTKDPETFYNALRKSSQESIRNLITPCCGWSSVMTMLYLADRRDDLELVPILYKNSGDSSIGDKDRVVGYWAIAGQVLPPEDFSPFALTPPEKEQLIQISRATLESYIKKGTLYEVPRADLPSVLQQPAGAFVSLYMGGKLRGCIGNFAPDKPLYTVVQEMTIAAATHDPRFAPVESPELPYISIEISVLTPLHKIDSVDEFQLGRQGIYMTKNGRSGTYLPQVAEETGWSKEDFLGHCSREKAGLGWDGWKDADLYTYEAIVFGEEMK